jgi:hypothetical protein
MSQAASGGVDVPLLIVGLCTKRAILTEMFSCKSLNLRKKKNLSACVSAVNTACPSLTARRRRWFKVGITYRANIL